jgi:ESCRT-II complex subunit VPS36
MIDKYGGVIGLVDLYCVYNRARGTDLISPEDLNLACVKLNQNSQKHVVKHYASGVKTVQSSKFFSFIFRAF